MTTYESETKTIFQSNELIFNAMSDLTNLQKVQNMNVEGREKVAEYIKDAHFEPDLFQFSMVGIGRIGFRIAEREPFQTIRFEAENSPIPATGWVRLTAVSERETTLQIAVQTDMPAMIKMMVDSQLKRVVEGLADGLAKAFNEHQIVGDTL